MAAQNVPLTSRITRAAKAHIELPEPLLFVTIRNVQAKVSLNRLTPLGCKVLMAVTKKDGEVE